VARRVWCWPNSAGDARLRAVRPVSAVGPLGALGARCRPPWAEWSRELCRKVSELCVDELGQRAGLIAYSDGGTARLGAPTSPCRAVDFRLARVPMHARESGPGAR